VHICFYFATGGPKRYFYWGHALKFQNNCRWANQYGSIKINKKVVKAPMM